VGQSLITPFGGSVELGSGGKDRLVVVVNEQPDGPNEIGQGFREGKGLAYSARTALAKGGIEAFQVIGLTAALFTRAMTLGWQHGGIGGQFIRV
jgi:hypothetical protein